MTPKNASAKPGRIRTSAVPNRSLPIPELVKNT
ncbi:hypothetical protein JXVLWARM_CDS_0070 [Burkholderia phage Bm1]